MGREVIRQKSETFILNDQGCRRRQNMYHVKKSLSPGETEYLIVGGGLAALPLARKLAGEGRCVLLAEAGTYLGYEIGRYYRP